MADNISLMLKRIDDMYKKNNNIKTIMDQIQLKFKIAGNYELAPKIEWHDMICFFSTAMQLIYRIEELIPLIIHPHIKAQYKPDSNAMQYIKFLELMHSKASTKDAKIITIQDQGEIVKKCIATMSGTKFGQMGDAVELNSIIMSVLGTLCIYGADNINFDYNKFCQPTPNKTYPSNDPRTFFLTSEVLFNSNKRIPGTITDVIRYTDEYYNLYSKREYQEIHKKILEFGPFDEVHKQYIPEKIQEFSITQKDLENFQEYINNIITTYSYKSKTYNDNSFVLMQKRIMNPSKYFFLRLNTIIKHGVPLLDVNIPIKNINEIEIEKTIDDTKKKYELIGLGKYTGSHYTAYIKHYTGWYFYDDLGGKRDHVLDMTNQIITTKSPILLYRQKSDYLFDTIDPNIIPLNMNEYLDQFGVDV